MSPYACEEPAAEHLDRLHEHVLRDRRRAVEDRVEAREVGVLDAGHGHQELQHRGHVHRVRDAVLRDVSEDGGEVDLAQQHDVRTVHETDDPPARARDVEARHRDHAHAVGA